MLLSLETSGLAGSVALCRDGVFLAERSLAQAGRRHARTLVAEISSLLQERGAVPRDCRAIAVSVGPGSFTGLRVGVVCAKTLSYISGAAIVAVNTFAAVAEGVPSGIDAVTVIDLAQRDELFVGEYCRFDGVWQAKGGITIVPAESYARDRPTGVPVVGPGVAKLRGTLFPDEACLPPEFDTPQARHVAAIGLRMLEQGETTDCWTLEPLYIRRSAAEEKSGIKVV